MTDRMKSYNYLKSKGICVRCEKEKALLGRVLCYSCSEKDVEKARKYRKNNHDKIKEKESGRYKTRRSKGLCGRCGKVYTGEKSICIECSIKKRKYDKDRKITNGYVDPNTRVSIGKCYYCDNKAMTGKKVCNVHYEKIFKSIKANREKINPKKEKRSNLSLVERKENE